MNDKRKLLQALNINLIATDLYFVINSFRIIELIMNTEEFHLKPHRNFAYLNA